jgi:phenylacetate-CoA ligase
MKEALMTTAELAFGEVRQRFQADLAQRLPSHIARVAWSAEQIANHQEEQLRLLLAHAIENSPYHARRLRGVDPDRFMLSDLPSLPVMTKADMMANFDDVVTDRRVKRTAAEEALRASRETPPILHGTYLCLATGGSSGLRGTFVLSWHAALDFFLGLIRPTLARSTAAGGPPAAGLLTASVAAPSGVHGTGAFVHLLDGALGGMVRTVQAPSTLPVPEIVRRLNEEQPTILVSYPSMARLLAAEQVAGRLHISPKSISTTSERLMSEARREIEAAFGVPASSTFASTEGLVGSSEPGEETIAFASDLVIVEPVDAENQAVPPGTPSARILVTNLYNLAQPLIRYEMTDSFVQQPYSPDHGHLRAMVDGRTDNVFVYGDLAVQPLVIRSPMVKTPEVIEYQARQTPCGVDLAIVANGPVDESDLAQKVARSLEQAGLDRPEVRVCVTDAIVRDERTGKARRFIPLA